MANNLIGLLDLSIVTDALRDLLKTACQNAPFTIDVTGAAPDVSRGGSDCVLSLYLFHVEPDRFQRNLTPVRHTTPELQPLALNLHYLLSVWAADQYVREQNAMSLALRCLHRNPIVRFDTTVGSDTVTQEFSVTMETGTTDELARLWQSLTTAARLSAIFKASVVFIAPDPDTSFVHRVERVGTRVEVHP